MIIKSTALYAPAIIAPRAATFILMLLLTRRLTASEYGLYALVAIIGEMLDMSASNWIRFSFLRSDVSRPASWRSGFARSAPLLVASTLLACLVGLGVSRYIAVGRTTDFALSVAVYVASNSALRFGLTTLQLQDRRGEYSLVESLRAVGILCSGWIASGLSPNFVSVAVANAAVTAVCAAFALYRGVRGMPPGGEPSASYASRVSYGMPIIALTLVSYMVQSSDRVFLKLIAGAASVGVYAATYALARTPTDVVGNAINQGGFPELIRRHDQEGLAGASRVLRNTFELMTLLQFAILGVSFGLAPAIANAVLPMAFRPTAAALLPVVTAGGICLSVKSYVFDNVFHATRKNWLQFSTYAPAGAATVIACLLLIRPFGAMGAAYSFLIGSGFGLASSYLLTNHFVRTRLSVRELAKVLTAGAVAGIASRLTWMVLPHGVPALVSLMAAGTAAGMCWLGTLLIVKPEVIAGGAHKVIAAIRQRLRLTAQAPAARP